MGKKRMRTHIMEERVILMDQVNKFATGDAHRIETRDGQMEDVSEDGSTSCSRRFARLTASSTIPTPAPRRPHPSAKANQWFSSEFGVADPHGGSFSSNVHLGLKRTLGAGAIHRRPVSLASASFAPGSLKKP